MDDYVSKPVNLDELERLLVHYLRRHTDAADSGGEADDADDADDAVDPPLAEDDSPPIDLELLRSLWPDDESLRELVELYLEQTSGIIERLATAIQNGAHDEVQFVAHTCKGSSVTYGVASIAAIMEQLERMSHEGKLDGAEPLCRQAEAELTKVKAYWKDQPASP